MRPAGQRLEESERERFRAAYCALCHALKRRYGLPGSLLLNFDLTFLAILLSGSQVPPVENRRCIAHPCRGCSVCAGSAAFDISADFCVLLSWWQLQDRIADSSLLRSVPYRLAALFLYPSYRKARSLRPDFDGVIRRRLSELAQLEKDRCDSLDRAAEPFAALMTELAEAEASETRKRVLHHLFYHLGRWIYLVDAADDLKSDFRENCYNPLRYRYRLQGDTLDGEAREALAGTLDDSIRQMCAAYELCDCGAWKPMLDSIFYESFYGIGRAVLDGEYRKPRRRYAHRLLREDNEELP